MDKRDLREAYDIVFADLISNHGDVFVGKYDAINGNEDFMYGVCFVMEAIALNAEKQEILTDMFLINMIESEKKANGNK